MNALIGITSVPMNDGLAGNPEKHGSPLYYLL